MTRRRRTRTIGPLIIALYSMISAAAVIGFLNRMARDSVIHIPGAVQVIAPNEVWI